MRLKSRSTAFGTPGTANRNNARPAAAGPGRVSIRCRSRRKSRSPRQSLPPGGRRRCQTVISSPAGYVQTGDDAAVTAMEQGWPQPRPPVQAITARPADRGDHRRQGHRPTPRRDQAPGYGLRRVQPSLGSRRRGDHRCPGPLSPRRPAQRACLSVVRRAGRRPALSRGSLAGADSLGLEPVPVVSSRLSAASWSAAGSPPDKATSGCIETSNPTPSTTTLRGFPFAARPRSSRLRGLLPGHGVVLRLRHR